MAQLVDGFTDTLTAILAAEPIDPELDSEGNPKPVNWKFDLNAVKEGGPVAEAEVSGWRYIIEAQKFRVTAVKVKEVSKTPEELVMSSATVRKEDTQFPGFMEKNVEAVKPTSSAAEKKAIEDAKTVAKLAPDAKTKKEAESTVAAAKK
jgi:hypothetical protein